MTTHYLTSSVGAALALMGLCSAALPEVESAVRQGHPALALRLLEQEPSDIAQADAAYWKGQALARLGRLEEAAAAFRQVPPEHALYPYAARGILYCAWQSPLIDFAEACTPLTTSTDSEVALLAQTALAEYQLRYTKQGDDSIMAQLEELAAAHPHLQPLVKLLGIHAYLRKGDVDGGIEYARNLEQDTELSPLMRQRVRLELAELYYAKEAAEAEQPLPEDGEESDEGKGEETLLQFITANPDSPLLEDAFRRLLEHGAMGNSGYTREKLQEWGEDVSHPHRAALALLARLQEAGVNDATAASIASRAVSELPGEPATRLILHEQIRRLHALERPQEAQLYLSLLDSALGKEDEPNARTLFYRALQHWDQPEEALRDFLQSAQRADEDLLDPALANSLICALRAGAEASVQALLEAPCSMRSRRALLMAHAGVNPEKDPRRALRELDEVMSLSPTPEQVVDVLLDRAYLALAHAPQEALQQLQACSASERSRWSPAQALRYVALLERAADLLQESGAAGAPLAADLLLALYREQEDMECKSAIALHLADRFSAAGQHKQAVELLLDLAQCQSTGNAKAATLLYAAQESSQLGNLAALEHSARLFAESARQGGALASVATIAQAAILVRINRTAEAFDLLHRLQQSSANLSVSEQAYILTIQADAYSLDRTPEGNAAALSTCEKILSLPKLPREWQVRSRLQHASICARTGRHADALADYREVMAHEEAPDNAQQEAASFLYYYAGSGAVYLLLRMERFSEAAALADSIAAWPDSEAPGPKSVLFSRWAQSIRQSHYLPGSVLEQSPLSGDKKAED